MNVKQTKLAGCFLIEPKVFEDKRGYFFESYHKRELNDFIQKEIDFVQDNQALSNYGTIRGLHFQKAPYAQSKLVRVIQGKVLDVAVDLRENSSTFLQSISVILSAENKLQLFIPKGFAHGYAVLENGTIFHYKCDDYYQPSSEGGIHPLDPTLEIDWQIQIDDRIISEKDLQLPFLNV